MNKIENNFVPYQESLELKELGFDEECFGYHNMINHSGNYQFDRRIWETSDNYIEAPLYQQAFKWFRDKHLLEGLILPQDKSVLDPLPLYFIAIQSYRNKVWNELFNSTNKNTLLHYSEYEEAELECLKKLIEIVKEK